MKPRLFLHLGLSKTGTTSIQSFLRGNAAALAEYGVAYPLIDSKGSTHPALAPSVLRRNVGPELNHVALAMELRTVGGAPLVETTQTPLWSEVFTDIAMGSANTIIISYENFYARPDLYRFELLAKELERFDVIGVIYLRSQEDWIISLYGQMVRGRIRLQKSLRDFTTSQKIYLAFSSMLDNIKDHIPLDRLIVGNFDEASASGLLADFVGKIGISRDILTSAKDLNTANRSPPHWATLFLLKCNQARISDETFIKVRRALGNSKTADLPRLRPGLDVATPEEREGLRATAASDADRLRDRYGVTLAERNREPIAYRAFDAEDMSAIREALASTIPRSALEPLDRI